MNLTDYFGTEWNRKFVHFCRNDLCKNEMVLCTTRKYRLTIAYKITKHAHNAVTLHWQNLDRTIFKTFCVTHGDRFENLVIRNVDINKNFKNAKFTHVIEFAAQCFQKRKQHYIATQIGMLSIATVYDCYKNMLPDNCHKTFLFATVDLVFADEYIVSVVIARFFNP